MTATFRTFAVLAAVVTLQPVRAQNPQPVPAMEIRAIAKDAYVFAYPLVLMEFTRREAMLHPKMGGSGEMNRFLHASEFPDARFRQVIRPNADTLYSAAWLDLSKEPALLHVPDTHGRYYLMQFMDAWTETFSVPGKRTTGTGEGWFAIAGPGWKGTLPGRARRIDAPTNMVWLIGRTQTNSAADYANVHAIQKGFALIPLSRYPDGPRPPKPPPPVADDSAVPAPPAQVKQLSAVEFFRVFASLLEKNPPHSADAPMMQRLARIGLAPGKRFEPKALGSGGLAALEEGARAAYAEMEETGKRGRNPGKNGWPEMKINIGRYGTAYLDRAVVARMGLGANPPEDAAYKNTYCDGNGRAMEGAYRYRIHFARGQTPPVRAFWSVTMYDENGYFTANPINRFAIGDRDSLKYNLDGSLDLYIQHDRPRGGKDANWLPAPAGKFSLSLRMYWPEDSILSGRWTPPPILRERP